MVHISKLWADNYDTEYNVVKNVNDHELIVVTAGDLHNTWDSDKFQKFSDLDEVPSWHGGYIKVECKEDVSIAVWADPSKPLLAGALPYVPPAHEAATAFVQITEPVRDALIKSAGNFRRALQSVVS